MQKERIMIFGASKGLGAKVAEQMSASSELLLIARSMSKTQSSSRFVDLDLSRTSDQDKAISEIKSFSPQRIFYFIGGGPFGKFAEKNWRDHDWAFQVNFLFPARLIYESLKLPIRQLIVTGSAIAESQPDKNAASYSASKHALRALIENVAPETEIDLRLFSPGYMDTGLLPKKSWPRELEKILDPAGVAKIFCEWANDIHGIRHNLVK